MTNMAMQNNYHRLIGYMLMQRLYAYLLVLRYIQLMNKVSKPNGTVISFKYNPFGRRIEKRIIPSPLAGEGVGEGVTKTFTYFYDNEDIFFEYDANGIVGNRYIHGTGIDEPLARIKSDDSVRYYQQDALGSVVALTDESGTIKTTYTYDPFGNTEMIGEQSDQPFQYTGRENDYTGLYYYRARYYSPELQRFISEDPVGLLGGINYYLYVGNNPVNFTDPLGLIMAIFETGNNRLTIFSNEGDFLGQYDARNFITRTSKGQFPPGMYGFGEPRGPRGKTRPNTGNWFIPILGVSGRHEMGLHGGGTGLKDPFASNQGWVKTHGCIRVQNQALEEIARFIQQDIANNKGNRIIIIPQYPSSGFGR